MNKGLSKKKELYTEIGFLIILFIFSLLWSSIQKLNASPDELMRYQIPQFIYENGSLPHGGDPVIRNKIWGISYGFTPVFSYMISALFMKITSIFTTAPFALLMAARMVSILFGIGTAWFAIKISKKMFPKLYGIVFVLFIALLPQAVFITSYVNNDSMAVFSTAFIVYMWIMGMESKWNYKSCILLGLGISICILSYYNAYGFVLCSAMIYCMSYWMNHKKDNNKAEFFKKGFLIIVVVLLLTGWWFIRNYIIYDGDFLGLSTSNKYAQLYALEEFKPSNRLILSEQGVSIMDMLFNHGWLYSVYLSFIGKFGYMKDFLPWWMYLYYTFLFFVGIAGCFLNFKSIFWLRREGRWQQKSIFNCTMLVAMIIPNVLNIYYSYTSDYQPQGRYSLPMLIPFMYFITLGIQYTLDRFIRNKSIKKFIVITCACMIVLIVVLSYTMIFVPSNVK